MDAAAAFRLANGHLKRLGLFARGWRVDFHNRKRSLGTCAIKRNRRTGAAESKKILLSSYFLSRVSDEQIEDTILHECAHALDYERHGKMSGHGARWQAICREIGCRPERTASVKVKHDYKYLLKFGNEVIRGYHKFPAAVARNLHKMFLKGQESETLGKLRLFEVVG